MHYIIVRSIVREAKIESKPYFRIRWYDSCTNLKSIYAVNNPPNIES